MKFRPRTFEAARFCALKKVEANNVEDAEVDPLCVQLQSVGSDLGDQQVQIDVEVGMDVDG